MISSQSTADSSLTPEGLLEALEQWAVGKGMLASRASADQLDIRRGSQRVLRWKFSGDENGRVFEFRSLEEFPVVAAVKCQVCPTGSKVSIDVLGDFGSGSFFIKSKMQQAVDLLAGQISEWVSSETPPAIDAAPLSRSLDTDDYDQLLRLKGLLDGNVITQEEFNTEKAKILGG